MEPADRGPALDNPDGADPNVPHPARVYDYWLGGDVNFPVDREAAERVLAATPGLRLRVRANRDFLARVVRYLAGPAGIDQFVDLGSGIPTTPNVHEVAQAVNPAARVVYVDNDPAVLAYAKPLLTGTDEGVTDIVRADLRFAQQVLAAAGRTVDLTRPVGLLLLGVLHLIQDAEDPWGIVTEYSAALAAGSHVAIFHPAVEMYLVHRETLRRYDERVAVTRTLRDRAEVARFFTGLDLVEPGLVQVHQWRPDPVTDMELPAGFASGHAGVARKP
ncbi:MAG TPA: SAM-dependent methyltransferase [Micromonosporaceae bacterium]|nr:SAM-dependent methyltransferase [Micromonosporaceae bacterium]